MHEKEQRPGDAAAPRYPTGRGYGHDYMRGGEVFGGYGYAERADYARRRGEPGHEPPAAGRPSDPGP